MLYKKKTKKWDGEKGKKMLQVYFYLSKIEMLRPQDYCFGCCGLDLQIFLRSWNKWKLFEFFFFFVWELSRMAAAAVFICFIVCCYCGTQMYCYNRHRCDSVDGCYRYYATCRAPWSRHHPPSQTHVAYEMNYCWWWTCLGFRPRSAYHLCIECW